MLRMLHNTQVQQNSPLFTFAKSQSLLCDLRCVHWQIQIKFVVSVAVQLFLTMTLMTGSTLRKKQFISGSSIGKHLIRNEFFKSGNLVL